MSEEHRPELDIMSPSSGVDAAAPATRQATPGPLYARERSELGFRLVKQASDRYRRAGSRLERARKALRSAEEEYTRAKADLKLSIDAVQPSLSEVTSGEALPGE